MKIQDDLLIRHGFRHLGHFVWRREKDNVMFDTKNQVITKEGKQIPCNSKKTFLIEIGG